MEQIFAFPSHGMGLGLVQMPLQNAMPSAVEYSLNPNAVEFVPSYRQRSEFPSADTKTEATSTTTLLHPEVVGDAVNRVANGFHVQHQLLDFLSQLGDEQMPLDEISVGLLPGGQGLSMTFTKKQADQQLQPPDPISPIILERQSLQLAVGDQEKLASRPESVLVAQFLIRVNDILSEKCEYSGEGSVCPKCTLCSNRSYTELEIEHQIEGIKAFEKFFTFTDSTRYQDLVSHKAFKELCHKLGLIVSRDQIHINRADSRASTAVPPPTAQSSSVTVCMSNDEMKQGVETASYAGDDESQLNGGELTPRGCAGSSIPTEYIRGKLYRYEDSEGSQLVNQLNDAHQDAEPMMIDDFHLDVPSTTPDKSVMGTSVPATFPRVYKSAKAKCSARGAGPSGLQGGSQVPRSSIYGRSMVTQVQGTPSIMQRLRSTAVGGHMQAGSAVQRKVQMEPSSNGGAARKLNRLASAKSGCVYQQSGNMSAVQTGRVNRPGKTSNAVQKQQSNHTCKAGKSTVTNRMGMSTPKQPHGTAQRMIPRSTNASMMRQTEVKRRMSLMRNDSDSDLLYNEYLFK
ncbi:uncharacterized protein LOC108033692 [Drosophila biarmipes]|uniref:uncharacterized protein LOC108033692 n=1 Tax=Drosophila biarmipes TaxID=125945 RepID=UPI0007E87C18|nr:uncharacterized protein LOC108033692 [Drosophila biarmipes]